MTKTVITIAFYSKVEVKWWSKKKIFKNPVKLENYELEEKNNFGQEKMP